MKRELLLLAFLFVIFKGFTNPLPVPPVISEIYFSEGILQIEFYFDDFWWYENFDELNLVSSTDTVEFIDGIEITLYETFVLDYSHLAGAFDFNPEGDFIDIIDDEWGQSIGYGAICFGNHPYAMLPAPSSNQSIAYDKYYNWEWGFYDYALTIEQPPSIGINPFITFARGNLEGYVVDLENNPVSGATILDVITNGTGYFIKTDLYCCIYSFLKVYYGGVEYFFPDDFILEPYDTTEMIFQIDTLLTSIYNLNKLSPDITNKPNPFRGSTTFSIQIPQEMNFNIGFLCIYKLSGKLVDQIEIPENDYTAEWQSNNLEPGIYLYNIVLDSKQFATKKLIIL